MIWCVRSTCSKRRSVGHSPCRRNLSLPTLPRKCPEQGTASKVQCLPREHRKRCTNSNTDGSKCNSVQSQRRFLSTNRARPVSFDRSTFLASHVVKPKVESKATHLCHSSFLLVSVRWRRCQRHSLVLGRRVSVVRPHPSEVPLRSARGSTGKGRRNSAAPGEEEGLE